MTAHKDFEDSIAMFTNADRELIRATADRVSAIACFLFGSPDKPNDSLILQIDRNTRFRQTAGKILCAIVPTVIMIIFYLVTKR